MPVNMADDRALTSLPNDQNFTLHYNAMKAIKSLNDQDILVYDGTRLKWNGDLSLLRNFFENIVGLVGAWKSTGSKSKQFANSNSDIIVAWYLVSGLLSLYERREFLSNKL